MSCLNAVEFEIIRNHVEGDALSDSVYRAEVGALTLRLLDEHLSLRGALEEALDVWASLYEDRWRSGEPLEDPRIAEIRQLLDGTPSAAVNWEACYRRLHRDVAEIIGEDHAALVSAFAVLAWFMGAPSDSTTAPGAVRVDAWTAMTDEGRLAFLAACQCCRNCGSLDTGCQCDNDE